MVLESERQRKKRRYSEGIESERQRKRGREIARG